MSSQYLHRELELEMDSSPVTDSARVGCSGFILPIVLKLFTTICLGSETLRGMGFLTTSNCRQNTRSTQRVTIRKRGKSSYRIT